MIRQFFVSLVLGLVMIVGLGMSPVLAEKYTQTQQMPTQTEQTYKQEPYVQSQQTYKQEPYTQPEQTYKQEPYTQTEQKNAQTKQKSQNIEE